MIVSIRDEIVMRTGFDSLHEALTFFDLRNVEMLVNKDAGVRSLHPTPEQPRLFLDRADDVAKLEPQTKGSGLHITAYLQHNDFNAPNIELSPRDAEKARVRVQQIHVPDPGG